VTKPDLDRALDARRAGLKHAMTKVEFAWIVAETLAGIGCGHTGFQPDDELRTVTAGAPMFPLRVFSERGRLMVLFNDTAGDQTIRPGMEIVESTGRKTTEALASMLARMPGESN
jgi:hypothetical protein